MIENTKRHLKKFIEGIPPMKRKLNIDFSHPTDQERLMKVAISLLDNKDSIEIHDIRIICEEVGKEYLNITEKEEFEESFSLPIFSRIDDVKNIISMYRDIYKY